MRLLSQNKKMRISSNNKAIVYDFSCGCISNKCLLGNSCYAKNGAYVWSNVKQALDQKLEATKKPDFINNMCNEIQQKLKSAKKQQKQLYIRIHSSGDFYNAEYLLKWLTVCEKFPEVQFYAYTKEVLLLKLFDTYNILPKNFTVIYSMGGIEDKHIDIDKDRHSKIFESESDLNKTDYFNAMESDLVALGPNNKIGLIFHGPKKYKNLINIQKK